MSVLIKGMEMPKDCEHCRFCGIDVESDCWVKKNWIIRRVGENRPSWCPLVEVPIPHGDLIDRWELTETAMIDPDEGYVAVYCADEVDEAPVVIEAEE